MIYVVGCGPSLRGFNFSSLKNEKTIAVNKSIEYVPNPDYFITMDYSYLKTYLIEKKVAKFFVANFAHDYIIEKKGAIVDTRINLVYDLSQFDVVIKSYKIEGVGKTFDDFRSGNNSGFCGLQLAILLGYKDITLLGFDMNTENGNHFFNKEKRAGSDLKLRQFGKHLVKAFKEMPKDVSITRRLQA